MGSPELGSEIFELNSSISVGTSPSHKQSADRSSLTAQCLLDGTRRPLLGINRHLLNNDKADSATGPLSGTPSFCLERIS
jgi:hypothetical protein